jgi:ADP-heptose:LPS heptosyltransferase
VFIVVVGRVKRQPSIEFQTILSLKDTNKTLCWTMRFLVIRACAIGDFVLHLPAARALAAAYPGATFTLVGYPETLILARTFLPVEAIHSIEVQPWTSLFRTHLPDLRFDAAWVWMNDPVVAENLRKSGIREVFHASPFPSSGHASEHLLSTVNLPAPELPDLWDRSSSRIVLHPGSGSRAKVWPGFADLARTLSDAVILIGPCETGLEFSNRPLENLSLPQVAEELRRSRLFIGSDSGITHIAAYWGTPTVALFGPTDPDIWGPVGRRVRIVRKSSLADISVDDIRKLL